MKAVISTGTICVSDKHILSFEIESDFVDYILKSHGKGHDEKELKKVAKKMFKDIKK